jgi:imidazolonepropionase-like amidohydrolase
MAAKGIAFVPTLFTRDLAVRAQTTTNGGPPAPRSDPDADLTQYISDERTRLDRARKAGVLIAFGSDNWYIYPGKTRGQATRLLLEGLETFGMPPADVLRAATIDAARMMGVESVLGSVAAGRRADLIALPGDPLTGTRALEDVSFVMKGGVVVLDERL